MQTWSTYVNTPYRTCLYDLKLLNLEENMEYFIDPIKNHYVDFEGKVKRKPFWMFMLISFLITLALTIIGGVIGLQAIGSIFSLAVTLPSFAIGARRLHDTSRSGWWQLLWLLPIIGWIVLIVFWAQDSK